MTTKAVATGIWLQISQRLASSEFVQVTGFGVERIEKRLDMKPGGLLAELEHYKTHGDDFIGVGGREFFRTFVAATFIDPSTKHATGQNREYWLDKCPSMFD